MGKAKLSTRLKLALEIARKQEKNLIKEHPLRQLFWESTLRCNLHCLHCGSDCRTSSLHPDMPKEDFLRVLDSIRAKTDPHKVFVIVSGGEPLMRHDLEECGYDICRREFPWGMVSNGLFLTPRRFDSLINSGLHSMSISLDGLEDAHNWLRGCDKSFSRAVDAISMLVATPEIKSDVITCVNKRNINQLDTFRDFLIAKGVTNWRLFSIFPTGRAAQHEELRLSNSEFRKMLDFIVRTRHERLINVSYGCEGFLGNYEGKVRNHFFACQAGVSVGSVLIDGCISACTSIRADFHQGNIYQDDFMEVWENKFLPYRDREWMKHDECGDCKHFRYCRGNGMHLRDGNGKLLLCHLHKLTNP